MSILVGYTPIPDGEGATPSVFNSRMSQLQLNIDLLNGAKLEEVITSDIADGAVTNPKLATNAVTTGKILDDAVTGNKIADSSVVTLSKLRLTTGLYDARIYANSGAPHYTALAVDSAGALQLNQYIDPVLTGNTLVTTRRRLSLIGGGGGDDAPAAGDDTGIAGEVAFDGDYIYICTSTASWRRVAISAY
jgi:hypothetical protein